MPVGPALFEEFERFRLTPVLGDPGAIAAWTARGGEGGEGGTRAFHLEIDTGMGRSGVRWDEIACVRDALDTPAFEGCYTQFHSADRDDGSIDVQTDRFRQAVAQLKRRPALLHVANSAGALRDRRYAFDLVRPGVFLYGGSPGAGLPEPRAGAARSRSRSSLAGRVSCSARSSRRSGPASPASTIEARCPKGRAQARSDHRAGRRGHRPRPGHRRVR